MRCSHLRASFKRMQIKSEVWNNCIINSYVCCLYDLRCDRAHVLYLFPLLIKCTAWTSVIDIRAFIPTQRNSEGKESSSLRRSSGCGLFPNVKVKALLEDTGCESVWETSFTKEHWDWSQVRGQGDSLPGSPVSQWASSVGESPS